MWSLKNSSYPMLINCLIFSLWHVGASQQQSSSANQHSFGAELQSSESPSPTSFSVGSSSPTVPSLASFLSDLHEHQWFMGELSRQEAAKFLEKTPSGTFLVRVSDSGPRRGEYALSIRYGLNNPVKHIKLQKSTEGMFYLVETKMFRGISELIHFYQTNSLERSFPEVPIPLGIPYLEYTDLLGKSNGGGSVEVNTSPGEQHIVGYCMAHLDFLPNEPNQISFKAGDKIAILSKSPGQRGFWMGKLDDKVGFFPSEFVKEINCTV